jgi:RAB protein geranylgeranyltransferase component A
VLSVKGKKVLHIDRNDHYGGFVPPVSRKQLPTSLAYISVTARQHP